MASTRLRNGDICRRHCAEVGGEEGRKLSGDRLEGSPDRPRRAPPPSSRLHRQPEGQSMASAPRAAPQGGKGWPQSVSKHGDGGWGAGGGLAGESKSFLQGAEATGRQQSLLVPFKLLTEPTGQQLFHMAFCILQRRKYQKIFNSK